MKPTSPALPYKKSSAFNASLLLLNRSEVNIPSLLEKSLAKLNKTDAKRYARYRSIDSKLNFICGRALLFVAMKELDINPNSYQEMKNSGVSKPIMSGIEFSISHSANWVAIAYRSEGPLGMDIQQIDPKIEWSAFKNWFVENEWEDILSNSRQINRFYQIWTEKESALKAAGLGVEHFREVDVTQEQSISLEKQDFRSTAVFQEYADELCAHLTVCT